MRPATASAPRQSRRDRSLRERVAALLARADVALDGNRPWDMQVRHPRAFARLLALGEAYMDDGDGDAEALDELLPRQLAARLNEVV